MQETVVRNIVGVQDATAAVIPGADVSVINLGTNEVRHVTTDRDGAYVAPQLKPGVYRVIMEGTGFGHTIRRSVLSGVLLLGAKRGRVLVHAKIEEALIFLAPKLSISTREFLDAARRQGLLSEPTPRREPPGRL